MTSGQPLPVRFQSWIFVCIVVAPLPSPSYVTMWTCTFGCVFAYSFATGRRTASTQTVREPDGPLAVRAPPVAAVAITATATTPASGTRASHRRLNFICAPSSFVPVGSARADAAELVHEARQL